jgi:2-dehydropantoate 2-reductase
MPALPEGKPEARSHDAATAQARIAIVGAGGIGGYFGARLVRAGYRVDLLARGAHLHAIRERGGIEIREADGSTFVAGVSASDDPSSLLGATHTIVAVKTYSLADLGPTLRTLAEAGTTVVPLLNGVDITDRLSALGVPRATILGGIAYVNTERTEPGVITRTGALLRIVIGELNHQLSDRAQALASALRAAGVETDVTDAITLELWRKFAGLTTLAALCGLSRRPIGPVRSASLGRSVIDRSVREVVAVARASGVAYSDDDVRRTLGALEGLPDGTRPSFLADLERGGPTEIDALSGTVVRLARAMGIDTPVHETAVAALTAQTAGKLS